jgi:hypothetical protein
MRLVLDAGALMAIDRSDRRAGADRVTVAPVVGQVWRDGARQAQLARALPMMGVLDVDRASAQAAGEVPRESGGSDVVDALVALATRPGDQVLTSDPGDLGALLDARKVKVVDIPMSAA